MAVRCPRCGREFDITLFEYGNTVVCTCGKELSLEHREELLRYFGVDDLERSIFKSTRRKEELSRDRERMEKIKREADRISSLILYSDMQKVDVEIAIRNFRKRVLDSFPDKRELFDAIYLGRFRRLWNQFRPGQEKLLPNNHMD